MRAETSPPVPQVVLVGEVNPLGADPRYALFDLPRGRAGDRLRRKVLGLPRRTYLDRDQIERVNLCVGRWSVVSARTRAAELARDRFDSTIVLLGRKVAEAFDPWVGKTEAFGVVGVTRFVLLPHPSGRCLVWNEPGSYDRAKKLLREVVPTIEWGSADEEER